MDFPLPVRPMMARVVPQDNFLFSDTLKANIAFGTKSQSFQRNCVDIMVIQINHAWLGVVKPEQEIDQSGLSVAGAPDDGKGCPGWDV